MKDFEFYVKETSIRKISPDLNLAKSLAKDSVERLESSKKMIKFLKPKYALENAYESIREMIDAILEYDGYKSYSHEGSISYMLKLGFSISEVNRIDLLRKARNGIKYYGEDASENEAKQAINSAEEIIKKLLEKRIKLK